MNQHLRSDQRIRSREEFQFIFKKGHLVRGKLLNLWTSDLSEQHKTKTNKPQIGVIVSRKVSLRANERNLWKRRVKEAFRRNQEKIKRNLSVLVQVKRQKEIASFVEIEKEVLGLLKKQKALV